MRSGTRKPLSYQGHTARKRFGQNFLVDQGIIDTLIAIIAPQPGEHLVEIGPGLGALTLPIAAKAERLTVIELDRDLAERLTKQTQLADKATIIQQDALTVDYQQLQASSEERLRLIGNLPYNISTPLLLHLFNYAESIADMHFMLQKEVVNRLVAVPGNKSYGRLSVIAQYFCQVISVLDVPPDAFHPAPRVDSAVVKLVPHRELPWPVTDLSLLSRLTQAAFNQRRKTLRNSLQSLLTAEQLTNLQCSPNIRAENLTVQQYCQLANWLAAHPPSPETGQD